MIITQNYFDIEDATSQLAQEILTSDVYKNYQEKKAAMLADTSVLPLRQDFESAKKSFDQIKEYGFHAPDYREKQAQVHKAKRALDMKTSVAEFRLAESDLQNLLDGITKTIASSISEDILVDAGNPFFNEGKKGHHCNH